MRGRILVLLGLILAVVSAGLVFFMLATSSGEEAAPVETRPVVVAIQPIPARSVIPPDAITVRDWPVELIPTGALTDTASVANKLATTDIYQGQPIVRDMVVDKEAAAEELGASAAQRSDVSFLIPEGKVAMAFPVNEVSSVAGAIRPGDTVDLIVSFSASIQDLGGTLPPNLSRTSINMTAFTLQNIEILRTSPWTAEDGEAAAGNMYTLLVDRQQAAILTYISQYMTPIFVLRPAGDETEYTVEPVTLRYILTNFGLDQALLDSVFVEPTQ
nr:Flp pilus assembly protein CpaB [Ardenticatena sp.]